MRRLQADALAEQVRLASMPTRNEADRFAIADRVLAHYDALIPAWSTQGDETRDDVIRARIDRLHALHARYRMRDLASEYEALRAEGVAVPRYALGDVASAYLYLRQPEQAAAIYQQVAQAEKATTTIRWTGWATRPAATTRWPRPRISTAPLRSWTRPARAIRPGSASGPAHAHPQRPAPAEHAGRRRRAAAGRRYARGPGAPGRHGAQRPQLHAQERTGRAVSRPLAAARLGADAENGRDADAAQHRRGKRPGLHRPGPAGVAPGRGAQPGHAGARAREPAVAPAGARMGSPQQGRAAHRRLPWPGL